MSIARGRVLSAEEIGLSVPAPKPDGQALPSGRVEPREIVDAAARANGIVAAAEARARVTVESAERDAAEVRLRAEADGRAEGVAGVAAAALRLASLEARADERALDRAVELARVLAERLLGEALAVDPSRVVALAAQALREARGARRIVVVAHPDDAALLEQSRASLGVEPDAVRVVADSARARGTVRLETEIGVLDADLAPQLDRLARKLRESLSR